MEGVRLTWPPLLAALCLLDWTSAVEISLADICGNHLVLFCSALHCIYQLPVILFSTETLNIIDQALRPNVLFFLWSSRQLFTPLHSQVGSCPTKISLKVVGGQASCAEKVPWNVLIELVGGSQANGSCSIVRM